MKIRTIEVYAELENLRIYLDKLSSGEVANVGDVERLLFKCWGQLELASADAGLEGYELLNRTEGLSWNPPFLTFDIERHGETVGGSIYAHVYSWTVDLDRGVATMGSDPEPRRVRKPDKPLTAAALSSLTNELIDAILEHRTDPRLSWDGDSKVKVLVSKVIPATNKQTSGARRKRFWGLLEEGIKSQGWTRSSNRTQFLIKGDVTSPEPQRC
jgi:hypothetical protein